jgi:hypothetical protein
MGLGFTHMPKGSSFHNQTLWDRWATPATVKRIYRNDAGSAVGCECGFVQIVELRVAKETELDAIALDDHGLRTTCPPFITDFTRSVR